MSTSLSSGTPPSDEVLAALAARVLDDLTPEDLIVSAAPTKVGRYEVIEPLPSAGGDASAYLAQDPQLGRRVVLRVLEGQTLSACERFQREARSLARLDHPHLLEVYDAGIEGTRPYLVQAHSRGRTLAEVQPASSITLDAVIAAAQGLHAAHAEGIVHGAISPASVRIEPHPRLLGLGLAGLGLTGALDPDYVAPELRAGGSPTPQSDVYSLGAVLYEALSGYPPRREDAGHVRPLNELRPELHPELTKITARALERSPERRFPSADAFAAALSVHRRPPAPPASAATPALLPLVVLLLTLSVGLVLGVVLARGIRSDGPPPEGHGAHHLPPPVVPQQPVGAGQPGERPPVPQQPARQGQDQGEFEGPLGGDEDQRQWRGGPGQRGPQGRPGWQGRQGRQDPQGFQGPGFQGQPRLGPNGHGWQGRQGPGHQGPGQQGWRRGQHPPQGGYRGRQGGHPQGGPRGHQGGPPPPQDAPPHHRGQDWGRQGPRGQQGPPPGEQQRPPPPQREEGPSPPGGDS